MLCMLRFWDIFRDDSSHLNRHVMDIYGHHGRCGVAACCSHPGTVGLDVRPHRDARGIVPDLRDAIGTSEPMARWEMIHRFKKYTLWL